MTGGVDLHAKMALSPAALLGGFSLYRRGILLVVVPMLIQIGLLALVYGYSSVSDTLAYNAWSTRTCTEQSRDLLSGEIFILMALQQAFTRDTPVSPEIVSRLDQLDALIDIIHKGGMLLPATDKSHHELTGLTRALLLDIERQKLSKFMKKSSRQPVLADSNSVVSDLRTKTLRIITALQQVDSRDQSLETREPKQAQTLRRNVFLIAFVGSILNLLCMLAGAVLFNRDLVQRLHRLQGNTRRIAAGEELLPAMSGKDEVAQVDGALHKMAQALQESARKEAILFNSVKTVLASLDRQGRIREINDTIREVLGFTPASVIGKHLTDIVPEDYRKQAGKQLEIVWAGGDTPFELPLLKKGGSVADTTWSVQYVAEDENLFCVVQDDTERRAAERMRKQVLQMVSHDLRSPLSTVKLVYQMLETGKFVDFNDEGRDRHLIAGAKVATMLTLVNNLLDIEKIEAGMLELEKETVPVHVLLRNAVDQFTETIRSRRIEIFEAGININVYGDKFRLIQILTNLLSCALRRSPDGGKIRIAAASEKDCVVFSVWDQGPILSTNDSTMMFAPYRDTATGKDADKVRPDLELVMCRSLIDLHGGKIWAVSEAGTGTSFLFSVPLL